MQPLLSFHRYIKGWWELPWVTETRLISSNHFETTAPQDQSAFADMSVVALKKGLDVKI